MAAEPRVRPTGIKMGDVRHREKVATLDGPTLADDFMAMVEQYVVRTFAQASGGAASVPRR